MNQDTSTTELLSSAPITPNAVVIGSKANNNLGLTKSYKQFRCSLSRKKHRTAKELNDDLYEPFKREHGIEELHWYIEHWIEKRKYYKTLSITTHYPNQMSERDVRVNTDLANNAGPKKRRRLVTLVDDAPPLNPVAPEQEIAAIFHSQVATTTTTTAAAASNVVDTNINSSDTRVVNDAVTWLPTQSIRSTTMEMCSLNHLEERQMECITTGDQYFGVTRVMENDDSSVDTLPSWSISRDMRSTDIGTTTQSILSTTHKIDDKFGSMSSISSTPNIHLNRKRPKFPSPFIVVVDNDVKSPGNMTTSDDMSMSFAEMTVQKYPPIVQDLIPHTTPRRMLSQFQVNHVTPNEDGEVATGSVMESFRSAALDNFSLTTEQTDLHQLHGLLIECERNQSRGGDTDGTTVHTNTSMLTGANDTNIRCMDRESEFNVESRYCRRSVPLQILTKEHKCYSNSF